MMVLSVGLFVSFKGYAEPMASGEIINVNYKYQIAFTDLSSRYLKVGDTVAVYDKNTLITHLKVSEASGAIAKLVPIRVNGPYQTKINFKTLKVGYTVKKVAREVKGATGSKSDSVWPRQTRVTGPEAVASDKGEGSSMSLEKDGDSDRLRRLSEKYILLSDNLAAVMTEKRALEKRYADLEQKYQVLQETVRGLEAKIALLEEENQDLKNNTYRRQALKAKKEVKELKQTVTVLRTKLRHMVQLIEGNSD